MVHRISKRLVRFYYIVHTLTMLTAVGFFITALNTHNAEKDTIGYFNLGLTSGVVIMYYVCSGLLIAGLITGLSAHGVFQKPALWVLYCILMGGLALLEFAGSATALSSVNNHQHILKALFEKMEEYNNAQATQVRKSWDHLQITVRPKPKFSCCGINNYSDWQDVNFGMTSLTVPVSCCLPHFRNDSYCGQNMLPDHENADSFINTNGCLNKVIGRIDENLIVMGFFGLAITFPQLILVSLSCFLVITKKI